MSKLQCINCDWHNNVEFSTIELEAFVDMPCPKCGTILLTEDDLLEVAKFKAAMDVVDNLPSEDDNNYIPALDEDLIMLEYKSLKKSK